MRDKIISALENSYALGHQIGVARSDKNATMIRIELDSFFGLIADGLLAGMNTAEIEEKCQGVTNENGLVWSHNDCNNCDGCICNNCAIDTCAEGSLCNRLNSHECLNKHSFEIITECPYFKEKKE